MPTGKIIYYITKHKKYVGTVGHAMRKAAGLS